MAYITKEQANEMEGPLWTKRFMIIPGLAIVFILFLIIGGFFATIGYLFGFLLFGYLGYLFNYRKSPRKSGSDGIVVRLENNQDPKFDKIYSWLNENQFVKTDLEPYLRITVNLSTKYTKKFELKSAIPVTSAKKAYNELVNNGIIDKKDKDVRKNQTLYFRKGMAMQNEVMDKSKRGDL